ncbi:uncharacterized protein VTP21DRAFT_8096 [Calcarisporiella thermophila]|uniref:uncharacterized protein n=1 Tax=Calcarisporiella thermophila TaxID=911321 RepID=UPI0037447E94
MLERNHIRELLDVSHWHYKSEGNASIALSYVGISPEFNGVAMRVRKAMEDPTEETDEPEENAMIYTSAISNLIGTDYVGDSKILSVTPEFLAALAQNIEPHRPEHRLHKSVQTQRDHAALVPDHTIISNGTGPTIAFEIKPKWGYLPSSPYIENEIKRRTCRFCMHQYLKNPQGGLSSFCPLDLYSQNADRMREALENIFEKPQNNLKVFVDGQVMKSIDDLEKWGITREEAKELLVSILLQEGILPRLKHLQSSLDPLGVEAIASLYARHSFSSLPEPTLDEWRHTIAQYIERGKTARTLATLDQIEEEEAKAWVREFLLAATIKDCSIMIAIRGATDAKENPKDAQQLFPDNVRHLSWQPTSTHLAKTHFVYKVRVLDLDPKPWSRVPYYLEQDRKIVGAFLEKGAEKSCIE